MDFKFCKGSKFGAIGFHMVRPSCDAQGVIDTIVDTAEDVGGGVVDGATTVYTSGTGLVGDALTDAYNAAADKAQEKRDSLLFMLCVLLQVLWLSRSI